MEDEYNVVLEITGVSPEFLRQYAYCHLEVSIEDLRTLSSR